MAQLRRWWPHHVNMSPMSQPTVSIVIPAANSASTIGEAIRSVQAQDYPHIVDIVVAAADEESAKVALNAGARVVENPSRLTPVALNLAIGASSGDVVVRVDAHSTVPPDYVSTAVSTLLETDAENVGGMQVPVGSSFWSRAIAAAMASPAGSGDARYRIGGPPGPAETVYLGVFKRSTLERLGGFDESYVRHQDYELNERIRAEGGTVWFDPRLKVNYRPRSSLRALARQYFDYGSWKRAFSGANPGSLRLRQMASPVIVIVLAGSFVASLWSPWALLVPGFYIAGLAGAGLLIMKRAGIAALGVPLALATMHLSWGLGFLLGQTREW